MQHNTHRYGSNGIGERIQNNSIVVIDDDFFYLLFSFNTETTAISSLLCQGLFLSLQFLNKGYRLQLVAGECNIRILVSLCLPISFRKDKV